ncbi:hypothetical protein V2J09_005780 [Rumex salicifolius]
MTPCFLSPIKLGKAPSSVLQRSLILPRVNPDLISSSSMESFSLPKLWNPPGASLSAAAAADRCLVSVVEAVEEEEESFFELEFTLPDYDHRAGLESVDQKIGRIGDFISDEKPDPRTNRSKPQSPMSILRHSAPKLRVFMFGKSIKRSKPEKSSSSQAPSVSSGCRRKTRVNFTVKLRIEDSASSAKKKFGHSDSLKRRSNGDGDKELDGFCKKYLNLLKKPLYVKLSNTNSNSKQRESFVAASFALPRKSEERANSNGRFSVPVKTFGKSRSASALLVGATLPAALKDDSLTQQNDGIQGAILHCKQSFSTSSKDRRMMSRCSSDTSHAKSFQTTE